MRHRLLLRTPSMCSKRRRLNPSLRRRSNRGQPRNSVRHHLCLDRLLSDYLDKWSRQIAELWDQFFEEYQAETTKTETARRLLFAALRGLADELNPRGKATKTELQQELAALASAIHFLLNGDNT